MSFDVLPGLPLGRRAFLGAALSAGVFLKGTAVSSASDIVVTFGERTQAGHGGVPVEGQSIESGNEAGHFDVVDGELVVSEAGVGKLSAPYDLVMNSGQRISIPEIEAATFSCKADGAEIDAANVDHVLNQTTASTISIRGGAVTDLRQGDAGPGFLDERTWLKRDFSDKHLTVKSADPDNRAEFWDWRLLVQGSDGITFENLSFRQTDRPVLEKNFTGAFISDGGVTSTKNIGVIGCDFVGRDLDTSLDWYGLHGTAYLPTGCVLSSTAHLTIEKNTFSRLHIPGSFKMKGTCSLQGNMASYCYYDLYNLVGTSKPAANGAKIIKDNVGTVVFGARWNKAEGPHGDGFQLVFGWLTETTIENNAIFMGDVGARHKGDDQQTWFGSSGTGLKDCALRGNLFLGQSLHGITIPKIENVVIEYNTCLENDPLNPVGQRLKPTINLGQSSAAGKIIVRNNITAGPINLYNKRSAAFELSGNVIVDRTGSGGAVSFGEAFGGPFPPTTLAEALRAFAPLPGSAVEGKGAIEPGGTFRTKFE